MFRLLPAMLCLGPLLHAASRVQESAPKTTPTGTPVLRLDDEEVLTHLARCRAVCFPPFEEDYGFVTAEAFASHKAVVTCRDSGGPAELVEDNRTGFIADPDAKSLSVALVRVMNDVTCAKTMGEAAFAAGARLNWGDAVRQLTAQ